MIQITRTVAKNCRAIFRRLAPKNAALVTLHAGNDGLRIHLHRTDILAELLQPSTGLDEVVRLPLAALADCEGRGDNIITLENTGPGTVQARWDDRGIAQLKEYDAAEPPEDYPALPEKLVACDSKLVAALADACAVAAKEPCRYVMDHIQLRGQAGTIVATDSRQLLVQSGFSFGWPEDVLIPATSVFGCRELDSSDVKIGKIDTHVVLAVGAWTLWLPINQGGRYPKTEEVIPPASRALTRCQINAEDAGFLAHALSRLPGREDNGGPVTLDLNGQVAIRVQAAGQSRVTELVLARSEAKGKPVRTRLNRQFMSRALQLGLQDFFVVSADQPILCQDDRRKFLFMPLGKEGALPPTEDALRIVSNSLAPIAQTKERTRTTMTTPNENGASSVTGNADAATNGAAAQTNNGTKRRKSKATGLNALVEEAEALQKVMRDAYGRSHLLLRAIKRQRKQSSVMQTALRTLKEMQSVDG